MACFRLRDALLRFPGFRVLYGAGGVTTLEQVLLLPRIFSIQRGFGVMTLQVCMRDPKLVRIKSLVLQWSFGCGFSAYSWKLAAYSGAFLLTIDNLAFLLTIEAFLLTVLAFTYDWSFFAYNGKVRLIRALRDCKQRSLTVSKQAPTVSKKASPNGLA